MKLFARQTLFCCSLYLALVAMLPNIAMAETFLEGVHYKKTLRPMALFKLENPQPLRPDYVYQVTVLEFFSYGCHWCEQLEPTIQQWQKTNKPDYVKLQKVPVMFQRGWDTLGKLYFVSENLQNDYRLDLSKAIFKSIHEDKQNLASVDKAAQFLSDYVVDNVLKQQDAHKDKNSIELDKLKREYFRKYRQALILNPGVDVKVSEANALSSQFSVHSIPTFVVGGLYETNLAMAGKDENKLMKIVNFLANKVNEEVIQKEIAKRKQSKTSPQAASAP